jgi:hypothetical protein
MSEGMTTAAPAPTPDPVIFARALLPQAVAAFSLVPPEDRGPALAAIDQFLALPSPASFLRASRQLNEARRAARLARAASTTLGRLFGEGMALMRTVPGLPAEVTQRLANDLPMDARSGRRLAALATMLKGYEELLGRVVADNEEMRQRLRPGVRRSRRPNHRL